ncbi:MAG: hypothetical protein A3K75_03685 [Euryarchaeota archaeon RBG_13_61_15]|nr:MAG: hypothetical protein A3K75_03685 [Euryarchaeota archaeon RBG_13_61_15]
MTIGRLSVNMSAKVHKLFLTRCDFGESRSVTALECQCCPHGTLISDKSRVLCAGETKFFMTPCTYDFKAAATIEDCERCGHGEIGADRTRVFCGRA